MDYASVTGLDEREVMELRTKYGKNTLLTKTKQSALGSFLEEFKSPLIIILLCAAVIALATGAVVEGSLIIVIVAASSTLDFVVSYKSQRAAEALAKRVAPKATVIRAGVSRDIEAAEVVPGDMVLLTAGDIVPADALVVDSDELYCNESALSGESVPSEKPTGTSVYMGSGVVSGEAMVRVTAIGTGTKFAAIISLLSAKEQKNEFEKGIQAFSFLIMRIVLVLAIVIFLANAFLKHDILSSLIFSLALAVGITPELLPMIIAVNLSRASIRMSKKGVIVKKLSAIESFGSMDILCTDKTGTLTEDRISVVKCVDINGVDSSSCLEAAYLNSILHTSTKTPLDAAIVARQSFPIDKYKKFHEIPFDFERRRDSMVVATPVGEHVLITKGAPEAVLAVSTLTHDEQAKALALFESLSTDGYRVLGVAEHRYELPQETYTKDDEHNLSFIGFIAFIDPPKASVKAVLEKLSRHSIAIKVITGDHRLVAERIVREVGLATLGTLDAEAMDMLSDKELQVRVESTTIFSRVNPFQKNRIIMALKASGHVVGYMGDGINDAPSLRTADVGISVENATDVAKDSADIVLISKNLDRLVDGVLEGRKTFANTMKYISMAISSNFGNMISMTIASVVLPFLPMLSTQILFNNLLYDGSQLSLITDTVDDEVLSRPNPWDIIAVKRFMIVFGVTSSLFDIATFFVLYKVFHLTDAAFQTGWFLQSFLSQVFVVFLIRSTKSVWKAKPASIAVVAASIVGLIVGFGVALSTLGSIFGFVPIPHIILILLAGITLLYLAFVEVTKYFFYKRYPVHSFSLAK